MDELTLEVVDAKDINYILTVRVTPNDAVRANAIMAVPQPGSGGIWAMQFDEPIEIIDRRYEPPLLGKAPA